MQPHLPTLKEICLHGTKSFPCAFYRTRCAGKGTLVKHHWHDEVEILYFSGGDFRLEINMEQFFIRSEALYFINPGELHSIFTENAKSSGEDAIVFSPDILNLDSYDAAQTQLIQPIQNGMLLFPRCLTPDHKAFAPVRDAFLEVMRSFQTPPDGMPAQRNGAATDDLTSQLFIKSSLSIAGGMISPNSTSLVQSVTKVPTVVTET